MLVSLVQQLASRWHWLYRRYCACVIPLFAPQSEKVLLNEGSRSTYKVVDSEKEVFTVLFMYSTNGDRASPMLMFPYKSEVPEKIVKNCPDGWGISPSDNGLHSLRWAASPLLQVFRFRCTGTDSECRKCSGLYRRGYVTPSTVRPTGVPPPPQEICSLIIIY
ncbi:hypothetical protein EVAR_44246_1 [Eumeta japonica]|uniref:Uncharacterized protein n=1 Tax=Eumeta variegata TaxID=151549 RepID=A0A4C1X8B3_EUMVA|nr:hypothetical protein EVAR_44246_1 [Eumeta japonica]